MRVQREWAAKFGAASATDKAASRDNWPLRGAKDSNFDVDVLCFVTARGVPCRTGGLVQPKAHT